MTSHELVRAAFLASAILIATSVAAQKPPAAPPGAAAYQSTCAVCHDAGVPRAPTRAAFAAMAPEQILLALENGSMITMAITLSSDDRRAVAEYLSGKPLTTRIEMNPSPAAMCTERNARVDFGSPHLDWVGRHAGQRALSERRRSRAHGRAAAAARRSLGVRLARRQQSLRRADDRGRARVLRESGRQGLFARRTNRLRALVLRCRRRRARGDCADRDRHRRWPRVASRS